MPQALLDARATTRTQPLTADRATSFTSLAKSKAKWILIHYSLQQENMIRATMTLSARAIFMGLFVAFVSLSPPTTIAQVNPSLCSSTAQCPDGFSCQVGAFGLKQCLFEFCNTDAGCSRQGASCINGICRLPGGGGGGAGIGQSGEGGPCGRQRFGGGVVKSIGCKRGLFCNTLKRCQRIPS